MGNWDKLRVRRTWMGFLFAAFLPCGTTALRADEPARIMAVGDSITESATGHASYRYWLWHDLDAAGYFVDFVGSMSGVYNGPPLYSDFDWDHEGHWGWRADQILAQMPGWAADHQPDVAMIHLGTNDLWQGQSVASTITELGGIIDALRAANPQVTVLLAQIIPLADGYGVDVGALNSEIPNLAAQKDLPESPVLVVDQFTGFDPDTDTWDGVHPDESGEQKMTARWKAALDGFLEPCRASWNNYGAGHPGTSGVPSLTASGNPVLGTSITIDVGNSLGAPTLGLVFVGLSATSLPTAWGGTLWVAPSVSFALSLPGAGLSLPYAVPDDDEFCRISLFLQVLEVDPGASASISFTPGLELDFGKIE